MQTKSRIPKLNEVSFNGALMWFSELQCGGLLFHPEDDPDQIFKISDNSKTFSNSEVRELRLVLNELEDAIGHDDMVGAAYPIFMNAFGLKLDA
ncbi:MAG: hypothetical protein WBP13_08830 [Methylophilaceae bacterium]